MRDAELTGVRRFCGRKEKGVNEKAVSKGGVGERWKGMYDAMEVHGEGFEREKFTKGKEMEVRIGAKQDFCGGEVGEMNVFAIMEDLG